MTRKSAAVLFCAALALCSRAGAKSVAEELDKIKSAIERKRKDLESSVREQKEILGEMELIDKKVKLYASKTAELKKQQGVIRKEINSLEREIERIKARLAEQKRLLARRLRARYEMGETGTLEVLFSSPQISELVLRDEYLGRVYQQDQDLIQSYEDGLVELDVKKVRLSEKQIELEASIQAAAWTMERLETEKQNKRAILGRVKLEKELHLSALSELEEAARDLEDQLEQLEKGRPETIRVEAAPADALKKSCLPASGRIESKFGERVDPNFGTKTMHKGVDIAAAAGQAVRAIAPGQVVFADWFRGYGNLVIIDHNNGFYSLYAHLDRVDKSAGNPVKKGTMIGTVGDTGSLQGPFLYFELRHHTQAIDPQEYLDDSCYLTAAAK